MTMRKLNRIVPVLFLSLAPALSFMGCDNKDDGDDASTPADMTVVGTGDMMTMTPPAPQLGEQIDRLARGTINVAVTNGFDLPQMAGNRDATRDAYNRDSDPTKWQANWSAQLQGNLAIYDGADTVCGNQLLACGKAAGCAMGETATAGRYKAFADVLADDRLYLDTTQTTCQFYLGVEAKALGLPVMDCGGRTPLEDVVDATYSLAVIGVGGIKGDGSFALTDGSKAKNMEAAPSLTTFPFLAEPNP